MTDKSENIINEFERIRNLKDSFDYSIDIDDKGIKRYKGLTSIIIDLSYVKDSLKLLSDYKDKASKTIERRTLERSLFISSLITYGRCFTQTRGRGIKLEPTEFIKPKYKELHKYLIELRHEYIAHAGISDGEKVYAVALFNIIKETKEVSMKIGYEIFGQIGLSNEQIYLFLELIDDLTETLKQKSTEAVKAYLSTLTVEDKNELLKKAVSKKNAH